MKKILLIFPLVLISLILGIGVLLVGFKEEDKTTNTSDYSKYFGNDGTHNNDIFPLNLKSSNLKVIGKSLKPFFHALS